MNNMSTELQMTAEQREMLEEKLKNMSPEELREFQQKQCIFCQIINGKIPSKKLYDDDKAIAILDINPATKGHVLLLPKEHYAIMPQIPDTELGHLFGVSKKISQALLRGLKVSGTSIFVANGLVAGQRAQHFIIHVIPRQEGDGLLVMNEKLIEQRLQQNVIAAIENKLNELLGVKKAVVHAESVTTDSQETLSSLDEQEDESDEKSEDQDDLDEPDEPENEEVDEEDSHSTQLEKDDVSLDDIANLFK